MANAFGGEKIIELLLGWFRGLFNALFEMLTGSSGSSLIKWIAGSWKGMLAVLIIGGCALNLVIYIIRWRPHWWWFAKKRMLVDDSIFEPRRRKKPTASEASPQRLAGPNRPSTLVPKRASPGASEHSTLFDTDEDDLFRVKTRPRK